VLYAPKIVSFDFNPPRRYSGTDNKRRAWREFFEVHTLNTVNVSRPGSWPERPRCRTLQRLVKKS
jgi:hypothetical protein